MSLGAAQGTELQTAHPLPKGPSSQPVGLSGTCWRASSCIRGQVTGLSRTLDQEGSSGPAPSATCQELGVWERSPYPVGAQRMVPASPKPGAAPPPACGCLEPSAHAAPRREGLGAAPQLGGRAHSTHHHRPTQGQDGCGGFTEGERVSCTDSICPRAPRPGCSHTALGRAPRGSAHILNQHVGHQTRPASAQALRTTSPLQWAITMVPPAWRGEGSSHW